MFHAMRPSWRHHASTIIAMAKGKDARSCTKNNHIANFTATYTRSYLITMAITQTNVPASINTCMYAYVYI